MDGADDYLFAENRGARPQRPVSRLPAATNEAMGWGDYLHAAWSNWWIVAIALLIGVGGAFAATAAAGKSYASQTRIAVAPAEGLPPAVNNNIASEKVATAAEFVTGAEMMQKAADKAGVPASQASAYTAAANPSLRGSTVDVVVTGPDAKVAASLSDALVAVVAPEYAKLYSGYNLYVVDGPSIATSTSGPSRTIELAVGAIVGLGVGVLIAVARESRRRAKSVTAAQ